MPNQRESNYFLASGDPNVITWHHGESKLRSLQRVSGLLTLLDKCAAPTTLVSSHCLSSAWALPCLNPSFSYI
jgi:hypothetical protein